jgi:hypothetical protein
MQLKEKILSILSEPDQEHFLEPIKSSVANFTLSDIYITLDDAVAEQKHLDLTFLFEDKEGNIYNYEINFDTGMPLHNFRTFMKFIGLKMDKEEPELCRNVQNLIS